MTPKPHIPKPYRPIWKLVICWAAGHLALEDADGGVFCWRCNRRLVGIVPKMSLAEYMFGAEGKRRLEQERRGRRAG